MISTSPTTIQPGPSTEFTTLTTYSTFTLPGSTTPTTFAVAITTPTTTNVPPPTTADAPPPPPATSVVTQVISAPGGGFVTVTRTSTETPLPTPPPQSVNPSSSTSAASTTSSGAAALSPVDASSNTSGLSASGKIAVAVVVPVVAVALIVLALLFLWGRRKQRKDEEELRRKEVEEYGFNPNNDPTLPVSLGAGSPDDEPSEMREADGAGYRGWGATPANKKASTTLSSGNGGATGVARSDSGGNPSPYNPGSPTTATAHSSDVQSGDPLLAGRPLSTDSETIGALGVAPAAMGNRQDRGIHRGPSNASSAYSGANRSDHSGEGSLPHAMTSPQYYGEGISYDEGMPQNGPYGDASYGGAQPVIRDVQARRNTRIENPTVFPHQGNSGIAQNF